MDLINARMSNLMSNVTSNARNYIISLNVVLVIVFFTDINSHPFMKTALIISVATNFIWNELQFDAALVGIGALNADALALDPSSNYAKKSLSAPVGMQRAILFVVLAVLAASQIILIAKY
jgi:hypothetical protein